MNIKTMKLSLVCLAIVLGCLSGLAMGQTPEQGGRYEGVIVGQDVYVRATPSLNSYPVAKLNEPQTVTVTGKPTEDWLEILPAKGCYSVISKQYVEVLADGKGGKVIGNGVYIRAAGQLRQRNFFASQGKLNQGDAVRIIGTASDDSGQWYIIRPPAAVRFYVSSRFVTPASQYKQDKPTPATKPADKAATTKPSDTKLADGPAKQAEQPGAIRSVRAETQTLRQIRKLQRDLAAESKKPLDKRNFQTLLGRAEKISVPKASRFSQIHQALLGYIREEIDIAKQRKLASAIASEALQPAQPAAVKTPLKPRPKSYDLQGILQISELYSTPGKPRFVVRDAETYRILGYVQNTTGTVGMRDYVGKAVGITGDVAVDKNLSLAIYEAHSVVDLSGDVTAQAKPAAPSPVAKPATPKVAAKPAPTPKPAVPAVPAKPVAKPTAPKVAAKPVPTAKPALPAKPVAKPAKPIAWAPGAVEPKEPKKPKPAATPAKPKLWTRSMVEPTPLVKPEPTPKPAVPAVAKKPTPAPKPLPKPVVVKKPVPVKPTPKPVKVAKPVAVKKPTPTPKPVKPVAPVVVKKPTPAPKPAPKPVAVKKPTPAPKPKPVKVTAPVIVKKPAPAPKPAPKPVIVKKPAPAPKPKPVKVTAPVIVKKPAPAPKPAPKPVAKPVAVKKPTPAPKPKPVKVTAPVIAKKPVPAPKPAPKPVIAKKPEPIKITAAKPEPIKITAAKPEPIKVATGPTAAKPAKPGPIKITPAKPKPIVIASAKPGPIKITPVAPAAAAKKPTLPAKPTAKPAAEAAASAFEIEWD